MTFSEYTEYAADIVRNGRFYDRKFDDHFIPQISYTTDVNRIFRYEQFAEGVMSVAGLLGVHIEQVPAKPARHYDNYRAFYDPASRARVESMYQEDIDAFGYEFEG